MRVSRLRRIAMGVLTLVCATFLVVHGLLDHAHADAATDVPVHEHLPGDGHHDEAGGSCDIARVPGPTFDIVPTTAAVPVGLVIIQAVLSDARGAETLPRAQIPLFLLHAALLI